MANPNPAHNPTDGLNTACYVQVTGTNLTNPNGGGLTVATEASYPGTIAAPSLGQGFGAVASTNHPVAQYALALSLTSKLETSGAYVGVQLHSTCQLAAVLKDVANTTYSSVASATYKSYGYPGAASWYKPSMYSDSTSTSPAYAVNIASVSASGLITGLAIGQCIIEVQFPTFDGSWALSSTDPDPESVGADNDPIMMIYAQILCTVVA